MPAFYKIDKERRLVLSSAYGVFSRADSVAHREKLLKDPDFDPSYSQIADFTQVTKFDLRPKIFTNLPRDPFSRRNRAAL